RGRRRDGLILRCHLGSIHWCGRLGRLRRAKRREQIVTTERAAIRVGLQLVILHSVDADRVPHATFEEIQAAVTCLNDARRRHLRGYARGANNERDQQQSNDPPGPMHTPTLPESRPSVVGDRMWW